MKVCSIASLLLLLSLNLFGQQDSTYLQTYHNRQLSPFVMYRNMSLAFKEEAFETTAYSIGVRLKLKKLTIGLSVPFFAKNTFTNDDIKVLGIHSDIFGRKYALQGVAKYFYAASDQLFPLKDKTFSLLYLSGKTSFVFSKNFSFRASFRGFEQQRKSSGGLLFSQELSYFRLPPDIATPVLNDLNLGQFRLNLGYVRTFIIHHYFITLSTTTGIAANGNSIDKDAVTLLWSPISSVKAAVGFQKERFTISLNGSHIPNRFPSIATEAQNTFVSLLFDYRFKGKR